MREQWEIEWKDYYKILMVDVTADRDVIDAAYKRLANRHHPDKMHGNAATMNRLNEAAEVLRDDLRRAKYDGEHRKHCGPGSGDAVSRTAQVEVQLRQARAKAEDERRQREAATQEVEGAKKREQEARLRAEDAERTVRETRARTQQSRLQAERAKKDETSLTTQAKYEIKGVLRKDAGGFLKGECSTGKMAFSRGEYSMVSHDDKEAYLASWAPLLGRYTEFVLEVRVAKKEGNNESFFGVLFGDGVPGDRHEFLINGSGCVRATRYVEAAKEWHEMCRVECCRCTTLGNATNTLKIVRAPGVFHLLANGQHVATAEDSHIRSGMIGFVLGHGLHIAFSDLAIRGVLDVHGLLDEARRRQDAWEQREAMDILRLVLSQEPGNPEANSLLGRPRPDHRETILVVVGADLYPQLVDGIAAGTLIGTINKQGRGSPHRWAVQITDTAYVQHLSDKGFPLISVGGPPSNPLTAQLEEALPLDRSSDDGVRIRHNLAKRDRRVLLYGADEAGTKEAVDRFVRVGLLKEFLGTIWG